MKRTALSFLMLALSVASLEAQKQKPLTFGDLISMKRLDNASVSPDGRWIVFNVREYSLASNTYASRIMLTSADGSVQRSLTHSAFKDLYPAWAPDNKRFAFISNRSGSYQVYEMSVEGGEPRQVTSMATGVAPAGLRWSPDGRSIAFASEVYPDCADEACNEKRLQEKEASAVKAQVFDRLPYRVWDSWKEGRRSQLHVVDVATGMVKDLIEGDYDVPPIDLGGKMDFSFSPDGKEIAFTMNQDPHIAWSTNNDIFVLPVGGGAARRISSSPGADNQPAYSPDGKYLAFRSMKRAGYEADETDLVLYETASGKSINLTEKFDRSVGHYIWDGESTIYFDSEEAGYHVIYRLKVPSGPVERLTEKRYDDLIGVAGGKLITRHQTTRMPYELYLLDANGKNPAALTKLNSERLASIEMNPLEEFWFEGAAKVKVHGFLLKPPGFNPKRKYPLIYLVHGGPQGSWSDDFHYRWNTQMFAAPGFVVVMVNPRGSTGYGQRFTDDINLDWGGRAYEDLLKGLDYVLAHYSFIDKNRVGAAGASYGGYMMNWFNGHTDRFKCLVTHSGIMNKFNMYGGTEELWFEEWEMGGPYWEGRNKATYEKWSPHNYVQNFKTPTLVLHGELDFRVPVMEGMHLFTVLQRKGIESRFVYFPDEGHWILKPRNAELWWREVMNWFDHWLVPHE